jgi:hypothetical protein
VLTSKPSSFRPGQLERLLCFFSRSLGTVSTALLMVLLGVEQASFLRHPHPPRHPTPTLTPTPTPQPSTSPRRRDPTGQADYRSQRNSYPRILRRAHRPQRQPRAPLAGRSHHLPAGGHQPVGAPRSAGAVCHLLPAGLARFRLCGVRSLGAWLAVCAGQPVGEHRGRGSLHSAGWGRAACLWGHQQPQRCGGGECGGGSSGSAGVIRFEVTVPR